MRPESHGREDTNPQEQHEEQADRRNYGPEPPTPESQQSDGAGGATGATSNTPVTPAPGERVGRTLPGVQRTRRAEHGARTDLPANAVPGKPDGEVDTRNLS
jgi:hypothetical protein